MTNVIVQRQEDYVLGPLETRVDVLCAACKAVIVEKLPSARAAYRQTVAISQHKCEIKVIAA
jgi:hypothetical protein